MVRESLDMIRESAEILNHLIEDLLLISRIESGRIEIKRESYKLINVLESIALLEPNLKLKQISLELNNFIGEIELNGDRNRIGQIFRIILDNAIKYSQNKSKINISVTEKDEQDLNGIEKSEILIKIEDEGIGIKPNEIPFIFDRFYRSTSVENIQGSGLGLSIAKELVELHYGSITVDSVFKEGTTFSVFLPKIREL